MKVLILNGSPRMEGNTSIATREMVQVFEKEGVEAEVVQIGNQNVRGCIACGHCFEAGKCVFDDVVNTLAPKFEEADGLVEAEVVQIGNQNVRGCIACGHCFEAGKCVFDDVVNTLAPKFEEADGLVVASPVYYASANATLIACLDRLFLMMWSIHWLQNLKRRTDWLLQVRYTMRQQMRH